ncbi:DNA-binding transcriptional regulator BolA-like isoform X1 [Gigantopelta aegis]|uniref:DNA-binding transcriptional regulator BolA-like isoform X1 n=2 Tax=Gigantopelta aegis TaxID=1735272 RepID=UPI001B88C049|nr:DNA-binding transcriptional regulator BolA-like isoform X1 [Gigantopelta aegis]
MSRALHHIPRQRVLDAFVRLPLFSRYIAMSSVVTADKPVESSIRRKLTDCYKPQVLDIINESYMHSVPKGSETHFKVLVVSEAFANQPVIKRHRMVNETLKEELGGSVHALSIVAKTPDQWEQSEKKIGKSPACLGGAGL